VDDGELVALPQESMNVPRVSAVLVGAGVEAAAVASIHPRVGRFRGGVIGEGDGFQRFVVDQLAHDSAVVAYSVHVAQRIPRGRGKRVEGAGRVLGGVHQDGG